MCLFCYFKISIFKPPCIILELYIRVTWKISEMIHYYNFIIWSITFLFGNILISQYFHNTLQTFPHVLEVMRINSLKDIKYHSKVIHSVGLNSGSCTQTLTTDTSHQEAACSGGPDNEQNRIHLKVGWSVDPFMQILPTKPGSELASGESSPMQRH